MAECDGLMRQGGAVFVCARIELCWSFPDTALFLTLCQLIKRSLSSCGGNSRTTVQALLARKKQKIRALEINNMHNEFKYVGGRKRVCTRPVVLEFQEHKAIASSSWRCPLISERPDKAIAKPPKGVC